MKNKQVDIIVEARMTSSRLPGKILLEAVNKPLLELMIERLRKIKNVDKDNNKGLLNINFL